MAKATVWVEFTFYKSRQNIELPVQWSKSKAFCSVIDDSLPTAYTSVCAPSVSPRLPPCLSICPFVYLSICLSVCLFVLTQTATYQDIRLNVFTQNLHRPSSIIYGNKIMKHQRRDYCKTENVCRYIKQCMCVCACVCVCVRA